MTCLFKAHVYGSRFQPCPPPFSSKERQHDINHPDPHPPAPKEYLFDIFTLLCFFSLVLTSFKSPHVM